MSLNTAAKTASFFLKLELIGIRDSGIGSGASNIHGVRISGFVEGLDPLFSVVPSSPLLARGFIPPQSILDDQVFRLLAACGLLPFVPRYWMLEPDGVND